MILSHSSDHTGSNSLNTVLSWLLDIKMETLSCPHHYCCCCCCCCCCCYVTSVMSSSVRPHRQQPTRLPRPWDSPGKNTGVGCHFLLQCMKVKGGSEVTQSCPTLSDPMDCSLPGSSAHGVFQVLEWDAITICVLCFFLF